jgi:hypothetical protein
MAAKSLGSPASKNTAFCENHMKFVSTEVLDAFLNIFIFILKDRYLKINNICGKKLPKVKVEFRHLFSLQNRLSLFFSQGLAVTFSHHQVCIKKKKGGHFLRGQKCEPLCPDQ